MTVYIDDILITGHKDELHLEALKKVLDRLHEYRLQLKKEKCLFMQGIPRIQC